MLSFVPMNQKATVYRQTGEFDSWGQASYDILFSGKCQIVYNTDLTTISGEDGSTTSMSATVLFNGFIDVHNGDLVEFTTVHGIKGKYPLGDVAFFEDYVGKIIGTRVVVGNGKRS